MQSTFVKPFSPRLETHGNLETDENYFTGDITVKPPHNAVKETDVSISGQRKELTQEKKVNRVTNNIKYNFNEFKELLMLGKTEV